MSDVSRRGFLIGSASAVAVVSTAEGTAQAESATREERWPTVADWLAKKGQRPFVTIPIDATTEELFALARTAPWPQEVFPMVTPEGYAASLYTAEELIEAAESHSDPIGTTAALLHPSDDERTAAWRMSVNNVPGLPVVDEEGRMIALMHIWDIGWHDIAETREELVERLSSRRFFR